ncbi:CD225/dispanin family protein [Rhodococcus sp. NPDC127528]|uniref:CD225/dispanin family protein n=1 Tax=unclassified Rhodococcus (in: high G+C Gram-positive bacteria) TaxID=192944 RepID=UPI0036409761
MSDPVESPPPPESGDVVASATTPRSAAANGPRPPSNAGWAVASLLFFWPLAFAAFTHAFNVFPLWASGEAQAARDASDRVRRLGQISLWIAGVLLLLLAVVYAVVAVVVIAHGGGGHGSMHHRMR